MSRPLLIAIIAGGIFVLLVTIGGIFGLIWGVRNFANYAGLSEHTDKPINVTVPTTPPSNSLAVFNLRPIGGAEAKLYAIGFSRALADRLYCAPTCLTQQYTVYGLSLQCFDRGASLSDNLSDARLEEIGKAIGVRYVIGGDYKTTGDNTTINICLLDTCNKSKPTHITLSGTTSSLPAMQTQIALKIVGAMGLNLSTTQSAELKHPNFTKANTLALYGRSFLAEDNEKQLAYRWEAVQDDPNSLFAVFRLLEYYYYGPKTGPEIRKDTRLPKLMSHADKIFAGDSHFCTLKGLLLERQFEYRQAEAVLKDAVRDDSSFYWSHAALANVARCRENGDLAVEEGTKAVSIWPTNASLHTELARDYYTMAHNFREGNYYNNMNSEMREGWRKNSDNCYRETVITSKLNPNCFEDYSIMLDVCRDIGRDADIQKAYKQMVRINPKNVSTYSDYASCYSTRWNNNSSQREQAAASGDKAFGKGSICAKIVRARILWANSGDGDKDSEKVLEMANDITRACKTVNEDAMMLQCRAFLDNQRRAEMLQVAQKGYAIWGSYEWRYLLGMGYAFQYEDNNDRNALQKCAELYSKYSKEIPFDPRGHNQYGWCLSHLGKREQSLKEFLKALELNPYDEFAKEKIKYVQ